MTQGGNPGVWAVRGVSDDIRVRMKVRASLLGMTLGELVEGVLGGWLNDGAPYERVSHPAVGEWLAEQRARDAQLLYEPLPASWESDQVKRA